MATATVATSSASISETQPESISTFIEEVLELEVHAFISQGFVKTSTNNYLARSARGSFELTEVGINFTKNVTENLRAGMQLFARKLGGVGNYSATLDWFYLDYRWRDWLGVRAGRIKLPFGLYNETSDIDDPLQGRRKPQRRHLAQGRHALFARRPAPLGIAVRRVTARRQHSGAADRPRYLGPRRPGSGLGRHPRIIVGRFHGIYSG